jgi:hypothetical protein
MASKKMVLASAESGLESFEQESTVIPLRYKSRRAKRRGQTIIAHRRRRFATARKQRKEFFRMKELKRIETRPNSHMTPLRAPSRRGHPLKHAAHRSGRVY